jgi:hypothetical protein
MTIRQVKTIRHWPSGDGRVVAILALEPAELSERFGLAFQDGIDDLGRYRLAAIALANGSQAWMLKHDDDPNPGTEVMVDADADPDEAQSHFLNALGLDRSVLLWAASERSQPPIAKLA